MTTGIPPTLGGKTPPVGGVDLSGLAAPVKEPQKMISAETLLHLCNYDFAPGRTADGELAVHMRFDNPLSPLTDPQFYDRTTVIFDQGGFENFAKQALQVLALIAASAAEEKGETDEKEAEPVEPTEA